MSQTQYELNKGLAQMLKGGVIMDVTTPEQAKIAEAAGACAVMALERIPADIRAAGGVSRMRDPKMIKGIQEAVSIPVMAKCRIGHFVEAQILEAIEIDYIDESEVLSPADDIYHIDKRQFKVPFVCGARDLGEALRRINEGAAMIRTKGEPGTGDVVQAVAKGVGVVVADDGVDADSISRVDREDKCDDRIGTETVVEELLNGVGAVVGVAVPKVWETVVADGLP